MIKWLTTTLVIALVAATAITIHYSTTLSQKQEELSTQAVGLADIPLKELSEIDLVVKYLKEQNCTNLLRERLHAYILHTMILSKTAQMLYTITEDVKYRELHIAARNLESFFIFVTNKRDIAGMLEERLSTLQKISSLFREKLRITDFTEEDARLLRELSEEVWD